MSHDDHMTMTWPEAEARLFAQPGLEVSSLAWTQKGKYVFVAAPEVVHPDGTVQKSVPTMYFLDFDGNLAPWGPSGVGRLRRDWIVGRSPGKEAI